MEAFQELDWWWQLIIGVAAVGIPMIYINRLSIAISGLATAAWLVSVLFGIALVNGGWSSEYGWELLAITGGAFVASCLLYFLAHLVRRRSSAS